MKVNPFPPHSFLGAIVVVPTLVLAQPATNTINGGDRFAADKARCASMQGKRYGAARIVAATLARPPFHVRWMNSGPFDNAVVRLPFCRLEAIANPVPRSHIGIEIWLPTRAQWNGRFLAVGAGGSLGDINRPLLADGVNRGFAAVATDNGHRSPSFRDENEWALGEPERIADFGYRAHHVATMAGKAAAQAYYGRRPAFAYMAGSSQGGKKAMLAAQRYPDDYDGILAIAPVYSWVDEMTQQAWSVRALTETPGSALGVPQMQALQDAARAQCAANNGLIMNPPHCDFDPARLRCPRSDSDVCLSEEQVTSARKLYAGPRRSDGRQIFPGFSPGGERGWAQFYGEVSADGTKGGGSWLGVYRYMVFDDPTWTLQRLDFDRDPDFAKKKIGSLLDADNPDLDRFARRGGKLIVIHGWADQQVPALSSDEYHRAVVSRSTPEKVEQYFRLFMVPGMSHSRPEVVAFTSPQPLGPNVVLTTVYETNVALTPENDALTALQRWVEQNVPPSHFDVRVSFEQAGITPRTVRACPAPRVAAYRGQGDPMRAESWSCEPR
jgi:feruloyl esterase